MAEEKTSGWCGSHCSSECGSIDRNILSLEMLLQSWACRTASRPSPLFPARLGLAQQYVISCGLQECHLIGLYVVVFIETAAVLVGILVK